MTEPLPYIEDVQKLTDAKEISQAYMGLKETNRYITSLYMSFTVNQSHAESQNMKSIAESSECVPHLGSTHSVYVV